MSTLAEDPAEKAALLAAIVTAWRRRGSVSRWRGRLVGGASANHLLLPSLQGCQAFAQDGVAAGLFQFVANLVLQPLQIASLTRQFGPLAGHLHLHLSHLLHQGLLVLLELAAIAFQLL